MTTAVYLHRQPSNDALNIIRQATAGDTVLSNFPLPMKYTRYKYKVKNENAPKAGVWGAPAEEVHFIDRKEFPFNWMIESAKVAGIIASLAKDSDRILLMFPANSEIPSIYIFVAMMYNHTVRVFKGSQKIDVTLAQLNNDTTKSQYNALVLPEIAPLPIPATLMTTPKGITVRPYQQQMIDFALANPYCGWFVDMGLGKTLSTLVLIDEWIKRGEIDPKKPILIVAPIMVALDTWSREVAKWGYDWNVCINVRLLPKKREKLLRDMALPMEKPTLFLTNPDQLGQIKDFYFAYNRPLPFEVLIIDELSMFKSAKAKRTENISYYRQNAVKCLGLTGTPASNRLLDIWSPLKILNRNDTNWAGRTIYEFQDKFFDPGARTASGIVKKWIPKLGAEDVIFHNLAKHAISMQTEGLVDLPAISFSNLYVELPDKAMKEYQTLESEIAEEATEGNTTYTTDDGVKIFIPNSDVLSGKLLQIAGGALYTDTATHTFATFHDEKLNALDELIESATSPILVFYYFESDLLRIQKRHKNKIPVLDSKRPDVQAMITQWNNGEIPVMLAHPASVGHGLNLQEGGHTIVWFSLPNWDNDKYQQANKRLYRSGQTHAVNVIHILAKHTIDEVMLQTLKAKEKGNNRLMKTLDRTERDKL